MVVCWPLNISPAPATESQYCPPSPRVIAANEPSDVKVGEEYFKFLTLSLFMITLQIITETESSHISTRASNVS